MRNLFLPLPRNCLSCGRWCRHESSRYTFAPSLHISVADVSVIGRPLSVAPAIMVFYSQLHRTAHIFQLPPLLSGALLSHAYLRSCFIFGRFKPHAVFASTACRNDTMQPGFLGFQGRTCLFIQNSRYCHKRKARSFLPSQTQFAQGSCSQRERSCDGRWLVFSIMSGPVHPSVHLGVATLGLL